MRKNTRGYHLYLYMPGRRAVKIRKLRFVAYDEKLRSERGLRVSKAELIREFLRKNSDRAFFSTEIAEALKEHGVKPCDVMNTVRRAERKGLVYVRGYRSHDRETPFKEGYLITWIDQDKPREQALEEAVRRTEEALAERASTNPIIQRVHRIRDMIIEAAKLRDIISFDYIRSKLGCTEYEAERAVARALQLYPDLREVKLFNAYRYYYHASMSEEDLGAAIKLKEEYIRKTKGRANRVGHNWEACVEWFIDKFTTGASFWTQSHRGNRMDPRRITLHLIRSVGGRRQSAEVDRVWEVTPGVFAKPVIYVLECKWGLVRKRDIDGFFEVLRWSKEFGVDTPEGRKIKQGVIGVFAGSTFNPREKVRLKDETEISLPAYAARMNIQLLKARDFNQKLRERGIPKNVTVQRICRVARDENEVRELLDFIWKYPEKSEEMLTKLLEKNRDVFEFEKLLERGRR